MKGIVLAGGSGTRLYPITKGVSKQLIPIFDKPMIYYPISTLMLAGIRDILIISTPYDLPGFKRLLGDGSELGVRFEYAEQPSPDGLAQAFIIGEEFIGNDSVCLVLGDNIFYGSFFSDQLAKAVEDADHGIATIFGYYVKDPERFGIVEFDKSGKVISVEEKPTSPKSNYCITGLYFYPSGVSKKAIQVVPSERGEYEITSLNDMYLKDGNLKAELLGGGFTWFDTGTRDSLLDAINMIATVENNSGKIICSPEAIAYKQNWIDDETMLKAAEEMKKNEYGKYLLTKVENKYKNINNKIKSLRPKSF